MLNGEAYFKLFQKYLAASTEALVEEQLCINGSLFCMYFSWKKNNLKWDKGELLMCII